MATPADDVYPDSVAYMVVDDDFAEPLSEAERDARLATNLPVPAIVQELAANPAPVTLSGRGQGGGFLQQAIPEGWSVLYTNDFETEFLEGLSDDCELHILTNDERYAWGRSRLVAGGGGGEWGIWPAAGGTLGLDPALSTYPEGLITQVVCRFSGLDGAAGNVMTEFDIWQDAADVNDRFFVGMHSGEFGGSGERLFYGYEWTQSRYDNGTSDHAWETRRVFFPDAAARLADPADFAIMWQFRSDAIRQATARGVWLDNVRVERYLRPESSRDCEALDPGVTLAGAPGEGFVSKGLNLPTYLEDDVAARVNRLSDSHVHWARLEFGLQPDGLIEGYEDGTLVLRTLDLKYFDEIVDGLCAGGIAVLELVDYASLARQDWQGVQQLDAG